MVMIQTGDNLDCKSNTEDSRCKAVKYVQCQTKQPAGTVARTITIITTNTNAITTTTINTNAITTATTITVANVNTTMTTTTIATITHQISSGHDRGGVRA